MSCWACRRISKWFWQTDHHGEAEHQRWWLCPREGSSHSPWLLRWLSACCRLYTDTVHVSDLDLDDSCFREGSVSFPHRIFFTFCTQTKSHPEKSQDYMIISSCLQIPVSFKRLFILCFFTPFFHHSPSKNLLLWLQVCWSKLRM